MAGALAGLMKKDAAAYGVEDNDTIGLLQRWIHNSFGMEF